MKVKISVQSELPFERLELCMQVIALYKLLYQATSEIVTVAHISNIFNIEIHYFSDLQAGEGDGLRLLTYLEMPKDARIQEWLTYWGQHGIHISVFEEE